MHFSKSYALCNNTCVLIVYKVYDLNYIFQEITFNKPRNNIYFQVIYKVFVFSKKIKKSEHVHMHKKIWWKNSENFKIKKIEIGGITPHLFSSCPSCRR